MSSIPYLQELLSLNDRNVCKEKALKICSSRATMKDGYFQYKKINSGGNYVSCIFGKFICSWNNFRVELKCKPYEKCGIEILGARPNAKGTTYSRDCRITVKELKQACKNNHLPTTGDKRTLLNALMKI
jgi:hypothetical protein